MASSPREDDQGSENVQFTAREIGKTQVDTNDMNEDTNSLQQGTSPEGITLLFAPTATMTAKIK